jgi:LPXTG-motif cell wall-anchored protein
VAPAAPDDAAPAVAATATAAQPGASVLAKTGDAAATALFTAVGAASLAASALRRRVHSAGRKK